MLTHYFKTALKVLLRRKFFSFVSLFAIAFTLTVLMVAVAVLDHVFGTHPPEMNEARVLTVGRLMMRGPNTITGGHPGYAFLARALPGLTGVAETSISSMPEGVAGFRDGEKISLARKRCDAAFWRITTFEFLEGGPFNDDDDRLGRQVAVITASTRDRLFGPGPALSKSFEADGQSFSVIGVVPDVPALRARAYADFFVPMGTTRSSNFRTSFAGSYIGLVLAAPEASLPAIQREFYDRVRRMESPDPRVFTDLYAAAEPVFDTMARDFFNRDSLESGAGWLWAILAGAAILFMLLPTVNLVNLNVSRILERSSEIGVRRAFGASRGTLVAQFVTENVIVTCVGGAIGLLGSVLALRALNASDLIAHSALGINWRIFLWACLLAAFFGVFSGVWPAWKMSRLNPVDALRGARR